MDTMKRCSKCNEYKLISEFSKDCRHKSGLRSECKECARERDHHYRVGHHEERAAYNRRYGHPRRKAHREEDNAYMRLYYKTHREKMAAYSHRWYEVHREENATRSHRWHETHREETVVWHRQWRQANSDKVRANSAKRRALKLRAFGTQYTTAAMIEARREYYGNRCYLCGDPGEAMDHVKPLTRGGAHLPVNMRPICRRCNGSKKNKWPYAPVYERKAIEKAGGVIGSDSAA